MTSYSLPLKVYEAVERDGLPRVATDEAGSGTQHVMYLEGDEPPVRSMLATDWLAQRGALPTDPTPAQIDTAIQARVAERAARSNDVTALRQELLSVAQSAVGVRVSALTSAQLLALVKLLLWESGAFDRAGVVRPLRDWIRR